MSSSEALYAPTMIDRAVDEILAHEKLVKLLTQDLVWGDNVGRWKGFPKNNQMLKSGSRYLWISQGNVSFKKEGANNAAKRGTCDLVFCLAQYLPKYDGGELRDDILQSRNGLVRKFEDTLLDSSYLNQPDTMDYNVGNWYFVYGNNIIDTEEFYRWDTGQIFPLTGKPVPEDWYVSLLTSTIYFNDTP